MSLIRRANGSFMVIKDNVKYCMRMILLSVSVVIILYLLKNEIFVLLSTFVIGNFGMDYIASRNTMIRRIKYQIMYKDDFNSEYFELYNEHKKIEFTLLYNSQVLTISIVQLLMNKFSIIGYEYITFHVLACGVAIVIWALYLSNNRREKNINALIFERKKNWVGSYSEKEKELLNIIAAVELD